MSDVFTEWVAMARAGDPAFAKVPHVQRAAAARAHLDAARQRTREMHAGRGPGEEAGTQSAATGRSILRMLSDSVDEVVAGVAEFGLYETRNRRNVLKRVALCALGGYGRREVSPYSDLDICLVYDDRLEEDIHQLHRFLVPFWWDAGFKAGYALYSVSEAAALAHEDTRMFTTFAQARLLLGDSTTYARLRLQLGDVRVRDGARLLGQLRRREDPATLPPAHRDLYNLEPDIKENVGGLRDFHTGLWMIFVAQGTMSLEELQRTGHVGVEEYLELSEALDFLWRIRNELHFETGKEENLLSFARQRQVAYAFGYSGGKKNVGQKAIDRFMEDYYRSAACIRRFLGIAARICDGQTELGFDKGDGADRLNFKVQDGALVVSSRDRNWFAENPARLMQLFWICARRRVPLSPSAQRRVRANLWIVDDAFRRNYVVRRYFLALCNRPADAGFTLRQMAESGLLGAYIPEFAAVGGVIRYEDFHSYPVDEHSLRAVEALGEVAGMSGRVAEMLQETLDHVLAPHILVLAVLLHDLGKAEGDVHVEVGARITECVCERIGLHPDEIEQVVFLVRNHMLMNNIAMYRDADDLETVRSFAEQLRDVERLRQLLLISYADLRAVGPAVWTEWKGALLLKLYLRAERIQLGRGNLTADDYWNLPKAREAIEAAPTQLRDTVEAHLRGMGERYFVAFTPQEVVSHVGCLADARAQGVAVLYAPRPDQGVTDVVVCAPDHRGLFAQIAGSFASHLLDVERASLFTSPDGYAIDCFTVHDAVNRRPPTEAQCENFEKTLRTVLLEGADIRKLVEQSRRKLFALLQPRVPVRTRIEFDNGASRTHTVIDVLTGDRTGLLYDIADRLSAMGADLYSARIVTDARHARDAFYVLMQQEKIEDPTTQAHLRDGLMAAIERGSDAEKKGVPA